MGTQWVMYVWYMKCLTAPAAAVVCSQINVLGLLRSGGLPEVVKVNVEPLVDLLMNGLVLAA